MNTDPPTVTFFWDGLGTVTFQNGYGQNSIDMALDIVCSHPNPSEEKFLCIVGQFNCDLQTPFWSPKDGDTFSFISTKSWSSLRDVNSGPQDNLVIRLPIASVINLDDSGILRFTADYVEWTDENGQHSLGANPGEKPIFHRVR